MYTALVTGRGSSTSSWNIQGCTAGLQGVSLCLARRIEVKLVQFRVAHTHPASSGGCRRSRVFKVIPQVGNARGGVAFEAPGAVVNEQRGWAGNDRVPNLDRGRAKKIVEVPPWFPALLA